MEIDHGVEDRHMVHEVYPCGDDLMLLCLDIVWSLSSTAVHVGILS